MRRALVTGASGQDGSLLVELLAARGYEVHGTTRAVGARVAASVVLHEVDLRVADLAALVAEVDPHEVYNLAAVSSVAQSWIQPQATAEINGLVVARLLAAVAEHESSGGRPVRFVQASSAEIFGEADRVPQDERTSIRPSNPYGAAKAYAHHLVGAYRAAGMFASSCILYNHESPRRPPTFVTRKITMAAAAIAAGRQDVLELGTLSARRDWGWAPDYVDALHRIAEADDPDDFIIATGRSHSVEDFVALAFARVGIEDWRSVVRTSADLQRPTDVPEQVGDARHAHEVLGWEPTVDFEQLVAAMVDADVAALAD
jgi:GDPmannose 4,6-dehydratase